MIKSYIFDMDGTLLSLPVAWPQVRASLAEQTGRSEFQPVFETLQLVLAARPDLKPSLFERLDEFELAAEPLASLHEGSKEVIELLSKRATLALVTMQGSRVRDKLMKKFALDGYFRVLLAREDSLKRTEQVRMALEELSVPKEEAVFVGDRLNDSNAARTVGIDFVFIRARDDGAPAKVSFPDMMSFRRYLTGATG